MIRFDFTVTDEEAQALFECVTDSIVLLKGAKLNNAFDTEQHKQLEAHAQFLTALKAKMRNTRVK